MFLSNGNAALTNYAGEALHANGRTSNLSQPSPRWTQIPVFLKVCWGLRGLHEAPRLHH